MECRSLAWLPLLPAPQRRRWSCSRGVDPWHCSADEICNFAPCLQLRDRLPAAPLFGAAVPNAGTSGGGECWKSRSCSKLGLGLMCPCPGHPCPGSVALSSLDTSPVPNVNGLQVAVRELESSCMLHWSQMKVGRMSIALLALFAYYFSHYGLQREAVMHTGMVAMALIHSGLHKQFSRLGFVSAAGRGTACSAQAGARSGLLLRWAAGGQVGWEVAGIAHRRQATWKANGGCGTNDWGACTPAHLTQYSNHPPTHPPTQRASCCVT